MTMPERLQADSPTAQDLRRQLVSALGVSGDVRTERVRLALLRVPRHLFVPAGVPLEDAYANWPLPIGLGQTISQPAVVALMTESLNLRGDEHVLEIGTGSGYQAAILGCLSRDVYSVEYFAELAARSGRTLSRLGFDNVHVRHGDGTLGWQEEAPFDRILATAAAPRVPKAWFEQLKDGGVLVAPVGEYGQRLLRFTRRGDRFKREDLGWVAFVPMLPRDA